MSAGAWGLGILLTGLLVGRIGFWSVWTLLTGVGPQVLWMFVAYAAGTTLAALPWRQLLPMAARPTWSGAVSSRFAASGINALFPFFGAGEAGRLLWIERRFWPDGVAALIADRLLFVVAGALLLVAGVVAAFGNPALPRDYEVAGALIAMVIVLGVALIAVIAVRGRLIGGLTRGLRALGLSRRGGRSVTLASAPHDAALRAVLRGSKARLLAGLGVHVAARMLLAGEVYAGLRALGVRATLAETLVFVAVPIALSVVGTFVPGQLGIQEGVQALVATALGIGPATGIALVLLSRARQLLFVPLAAVLLQGHPAARVTVDQDRGS